MSMLFKRFKDWATSITTFRTGDVIPVDGPSGTAKIGYSDLAKEVIKDSANNPEATEVDMVAGSKIPIMTAGGPKALPGDAITPKTYAQNVAHSIAPEFDPDSQNGYKAGTPVTYQGKLKLFSLDHAAGQGWLDSDNFNTSVENIMQLKYGKPNGEYTITTKIGIAPVSIGGGVNEFVASTDTFDSYIIRLDGSVNNVVQYEITASGFYRCAHLDDLPYLGMSVDSLKSSSSGTCRSKYLVIVTYPINSEVKVSSKSCGIYSVKENADKSANQNLQMTIGNESGNLTLTEFMGLIPAINVHKYTPANETYNSFICRVDGTKENPVSYYIEDTSLFHCAYSDVIPTENMGVDKVYTAASGLCDKKYLIVCVRMPVNSLTINLPNTGLFSDDKIKNFAGCPKTLHIARNKSNLVADRNNGIFAESVSFCSFILEVGGSEDNGVNWEITDANAGFFSAVYSNDLPMVNVSFDDYTEFPRGTCHKRYIIVSSNAINRSYINVYLGPTKAFSKKKSIKILFIGNSLTQDNAMYTPWFLKNNYRDDIEFRFGVYYIGSCTIKKYATQVITGQTNAQIYSVADDDNYWHNDDTGVSLLTALQSEDWDLITLQSYYSANGQIVDDMTYLPTLIEWLKTNANKPFKLGWVMHQTFTPSVLPSVIDSAKTAISNGVSVLFPSCFATEFAKRVIAQGDLTADNTHSREGFPCAMGGYVFGSVIAKILGLPDKVFGDKNRITQEQQKGMHVGGPNGPFIAGTETEWAQIQDAAVKAVSSSDVILYEGKEMLYSVIAPA